MERHQRKRMHVDLPYTDDESNWVFHPAVRLCPENICKEAIHVVLQDTLEGQSILEKYRRNQILEDKDRSSLVTLLIYRCDVNKIPRPPVFLDKLADAIIELFPNESKDIYYISPATQGNLSKNAKGKLPDKWKNVLFRLRSCGVIEKKNRKLSENTAPVIGDVNTSTSIDTTLLSKVNWLKQNHEPLDEVRQYWQDTFEYRRIQFNNLQCTKASLEEWPLLKSSIGPELISTDFKIMYPHEDQSIEKNFERIFSIIYENRRLCIRKSYGVSLCEKYDMLLKENDMSVDLDALRILILPYLLQTKSRVKTTAKTILPSTSEVSDGLVIWSETEHGIISAIQERSARYESLKQKVQPCVVILASDLKEIEAVYVSIYDKLWKMNSVSEAIDVTFKTFFVFHLQYPVDCQHIWLMLQQNVYNIYLDSDKKIPILTNINVLLKTKLSE